MIDRNQLILKYLSLAEGIAINLCLNRKIGDFLFIEDCRSVAVEGLIKAIDSFDGLKKSSLKTWVIRRVRFKVLDHFRKEKWPRTCAKKNIQARKNFINLENIDDFKEEIDLSVNGTENKICNKDLAYKILRYIDKPKTKKNSRTDMAEIFHLYFIEGVSMKEIALVKGCSVANISMIIKDAIPKIQKHFKNETIN